MKLAMQALIKYLCGLILVGVLLFWPAGGFDYPNGWLFLILLFVPMLILGIVLLIRSPELLGKRLGVKEKESTQKGVVAAAGLLFVCGFVVAGLDHRFGWSRLPLGVVIAASAVLLISYGLYAEVMRENAYLSRTVEVQKGQRVIDSGLYGIVRHPMYAATVGLFLSIPLVLGSLPALACFAPYVIVIAIRIRSEERVLEQGLEGYADYKKRVKYRLIPFLW